jgi:hypothetical protein
MDERFREGLIIARASGIMNAPVTLPDPTDLPVWALAR